MRTQASRVPQVLIIEDAQWADDTTLELVDVFRKIADFGVLYLTLTGGVTFTADNASLAGNDISLVFDGIEDIRCDLELCSGTDNNSGLKKIRVV